VVSFARRIVVVVTAACALLLIASAAGAQTYVSGLSVSDTSPAPGAQITLRVGGLTPNRPAPVVIDSTPVATPVADANGAATETITIPASLPTGEHLLVVQQGAGATERVVYSQSLTVENGATAFSRPDGSSTSALAIGALVVVALASVAVLRRRTRRAA
jgi:hypothetical protein